MQTTPFGNRIRTLREAKRFSQSDLAHATDVPQSMISRYELGKVDRCYANHLAALALALGVTMDYLWWGERAPRQKPPTEA